MRTFVPKSGVILRLFCLRVMLPFATRLVSLPRLVETVARPGQNVKSSEQELATKVAARLWRRSDKPCLERSLALYSELGRLGADITLVCGLSRANPHLGHAWVERDSRPVLEATNPRGEFEALFAFDRMGVRLPS